MTDDPLSHEQVGRIDAYWRAANYLSVGQIYLRDNPLLKLPLLQLPSVAQNTLQRLIDKTPYELRFLRRRFAARSGIANPV